MERKGDERGMDLVYVWEGRMRLKHPSLRFSVDLQL